MVVQAISVSLLDAPAALDYTLRPIAMTNTTFGLYRRRIAVIAVCLFLSSALAAQSKRPLKHTDYDAWRSISNPSLSPDGKFLVYGLLPQEGDGEVVVRNLQSGVEWRQPAGARPEAPRANPLAELLPEAETPRPRGITVSFTPDSRVVVYSTFAAKAEIDRAKRTKKRADDMPKGGLVIVDLATGAATRIERVKSFELPEKDGDVLAYL